MQHFLLDSYYENWQFLESQQNCVYFEAFCQRVNPIKESKAAGGGGKKEKKTKPINKQNTTKLITEGTGHVHRLPQKPGIHLKRVPISSDYEDSTKVGGLVLRQG